MSFILRLLFVIVTLPATLVMSLVAGLFLMISTIWDFLED